MLKNGKWANHYDCCIECGTTEKYHGGHGLCVLCYYKNDFEEITRKKREYYKKNSRKISKRRKEQRGEKIEEVNERARELYKKNPKKILKRCKKYREENPEIIKKKSKAYRKRNSEIINKKSRNRYKEDPEKFLKKNKLYTKENPEKVSERRRKYFKRKRKTDFRYKLRMNTSRAISYHLKARLSSEGGRGTWSFLPYTVEELMQHLEKLFTEGMTWQNYGEWHIDHKRPDCSFNYKSVNDEEFQKCWALENLQPLWAIDNLRKGGKWNS